MRPSGAQAAAKGHETVNHMLRVTPDHMTARGMALQEHTEGGLIGLFRNFVIGFSLFDTASPDVIAFTQAFASGALLTMVANTMLPEAHKEGTDVVGLMTVLGFAMAFALAELA